MLKEEEKERYQRQIILENFGEEAQERLKKSSVAIFGLGGLGGPVSLYLTAAGVGRLILIDHQTVELSNLNRQILYTSAEIGKSKALSAKERLLALNPEINIEAFPEKLENCKERWLQVDLLIDCLDNLEGRLYLNKICTEEKLPLISAAVEGWQGYLYTYFPNASPCLNCIFNKKRSPKTVFPVIGVTPGTLGILEATETLRVLLGETPNTLGKLLLVNLKNFSFSFVKVNKNKSCPICGGDDES